MQNIVRASDQKSSENNGLKATICICRGVVTVVYFTKDFWIRVFLRNPLSYVTHTHAQSYTFTLAQRNTQQGSVGEGGTCVCLRVDLPLHCYLLLGHKGAPWRAASGRKARRRMSQLELHREEDPRLSSMTTLSSMNTIYATGSLFSNRPPPPLLFFASHSQGPFLSFVFCRILFSRSLSPLFFTG